MIHRPFLSHQWADKALVRQIATALITQGLDPILDIWEFVPGDSLAKSMSRGISSSTSFVLFWSKNAARSENVDYERELGLIELKRKSDFHVICVILDDTPLPPEHLFRIYINWRSGKRQGARFDRNLAGLLRAIRGLPVEPKPREPLQEGDPIVQGIISKILGRRNLLIAYQCPYRSNPITNRSIPTRTFFDEIASAAKVTGQIIVLDHDPDGFETPYVYLPSYNLARLALESPEFSALHPRLRRALKAYEAPYRSRLGKESPWRNDHDGGAKFVAAALSQLGVPVLAILRNIHWEVEGDTESTFVFADEIPALGLGMSIAFDIWHEDDWTRIQPMIDYFVDDRGSGRKLVNVQEELPPPQAEIRDALRGAERPKRHSARKRRGR